MRAIVVDQPGDASAMALRDLPIPEPGASEVRIRVSLASCNFMDVLGRRGDYPVPISYSWIPGSEGVGVVDAVGVGVTRYAPGDRVAYIGSASYAEFAFARESGCIPVPDELDDQRAASFPIQGLTAWHILHTTGRAQSGEWVVIHAAAGGVGGIAIQLAKQAGLTVIATASSDAKIDYCKSLGADHGVNYTREDLMKSVRRITEGQGVDLVLDSVGQETIRVNFRILSHFGRVVAYGLASGMPEVSVSKELFPKSLGIQAFSLYNVIAKKDLFHSSAQLLIDLILRDQLNLRIESVLPLADARKAHEMLEGRATMGKILLEP